ncbi:MAG TPA: hypothetical protein VKZ54_00340 [Membranihabitans sp.]|nr:hypothetical protein [Membranihabitans sp.]
MKNETRRYDNGLKWSLSKIFLLPMEKNKYKIKNTYKVRINNHGKHWQRR